MYYNLALLNVINYCHADEVDDAKLEPQSKKRKENGKNLRSACIKTFNTVTHSQLLLLA